MVRLRRGARLMAARKSRRAAHQAVPAPQDLVLAESLDLPAAAPLAAALLALRGGDVSLDASAVRRVGGQCLQVLLAARATWQADGCTLRVGAASADYVETMILLGAGSPEAGLVPPAA